MRQRPIANPHSPTCCARVWASLRLPKPYILTSTTLIRNYAQQAPPRRVVLSSQLKKLLEHVALGRQLDRSS